MFNDDSDRQRDNQMKQFLEEMR